MPYSPDSSADVKKVKEKLSKTYKSVSDTAARQAIHVFNSVYEESKDEGRSWASVYSTMNKRGLGKKGNLVASARRVATRYRQALALPSEIIADDWVPERNVLPEGEGEGSQVPPARDSFGHELKTASSVFVDFANFLKRNRPKMDTIQRDNSGPWATTSSSTLRYSVNISEFVESLGAEEESAMDSLADALNKNPSVDRMVADALGIKNVSLVEYGGVHYRKSPADYEILDDNFYATTRQTIWQN